jgi:hypothetical protein
MNVKLLTLSPDVQEELFDNKDKKKRRNFFEIHTYFVCTYLLAEIFK